MYPSTNTPATIQTITLTLLPTTSTSPSTPTGALINRTLLSLTKEHDHTIWALSTTSPPRILILTFTTSSTPTLLTPLLHPLAPLLAQPPTIATLPLTDTRPAPPAANLPAPNHPTDILTFDFPTPRSKEQISIFKEAARLLTTDMAEASRSGGKDDNPCVLHTCTFDTEGKRAYVWVEWQSEERRASFRERKGGRANLKILMWEAFEGCEWGSMGAGFWEPLVWLGAKVVEEGCWVFSEIEEREKGWGEWVAGLVGWGG